MGHALYQQGSIYPGCNSSLLPIPGSVPAQAGVYSADRGQARSAFGLQLNEAQTNSRLNPLKHDLSANEKLRHCSCVAVVSTSDIQGTWVNFVPQLSPF